MDKQALTPIPLSPEEKYNASQHLGRGLFSILQMAKEEEIRKNRALRNALYSEEDEKVLKIPIPEEILPTAPKIASSRENASLKVIEGPDQNISAELSPAESQLLEKLKRNLGTITGAGIAGAAGGYPGLVAGAIGGSVMDDANPAYETLKRISSTKTLDGGVEHEFAPSEGKGVASHLKRNAGKYLGTLGGLLLRKRMPQNQLRSLLPVGGLLAGIEADQAYKNLTLANMMNDPEKRHDLLSELDMYALKDKKAEHAMPEDGVIAGAITNIANNPVRMLLGTQEGFRNAKKEFYYKQKQQIHDELMQAQKEYIDTLNQIKHKTAEESNTPLVDSFCNGIAHFTVFGKQAADVQIEDNALSRLVDEALTKAKAPIKPAVNAAATTLLGGAGGAAYLTYLLKKRMRERPEEYMDEHMPTKVELQPYH